MNLEDMLKGILGKTDKYSESGSDTDFEIRVKYPDGGIIFRYDIYLGPQIVILFSKPDTVFEIARWVHEQYIKKTDKLKEINHATGVVQSVDSCGHIPTEATDRKR